MVKEIINEPGRTFSEYCLLPGYSKKECVIPNITLETNLAGLYLKIPMLSAAMTSVTGYEMALALGKEGGLGVLPARLPVEEQANIVERIKNYEMGFVEEPIKVREHNTIEKVLKEIKRHGHSKVLVVDKNNVLKGMFTQKHYWETNALLQDNVTAAMLSLKQVPYHINPQISVEEAKELLESKGENYLVILDEQNRVVKLAFKKDVEKIKVGAAISTHKGWQERVEANIAAGVDLIFIDTSDAFNEFTGEVLHEYKAMETGVPICAGNVVTYEGALFLMEEGADIVKVGMSSGSICTTQREKAVGRAPMTALIKTDKARQEYFKKENKYVPLIMDGGITSSADMIIALTIADALMMGGYFNKFYEAAGEKLDEDRKETSMEDDMREVATWGEGSDRAKNMDRYGQTRKTFFEEGIEGTTPYAGRLKPTLKKDLMKVRAALSNAGCMNLEEFREDAVIELISPHSSAIVSQPHSVKEKK
ncbi:IMP dehydrogenase [Candidatus Woesearchaeota archaeon]|nr:IMP dehydrogenase [Candidatus Woesearchaeota archaeon]